jgi:hypothetical protein
MGQQELLTTVRNLKELMMMKSELEAEIETAQDAIKGELTAREVDELAVGTFKVWWTKVVSNRFDAAAFKGKYADLYSQFTKATETRPVQHSVGRQTRGFSGVGLPGWGGFVPPRGEDERLGSYSKLARREQRQKKEEPCVKTEDYIKAIETKGKKAQGRDELINFFQGKKLTPKEAILANCCECQGYYQDAVEDCKSQICPLHLYHPYNQNKIKQNRNTDGLKAWREAQANLNDLIA